MRRRLAALAVGLIGALAIATAPDEAGAQTCPASDMLGEGLVNNICWDCIFPLRISGVTIFKSSLSGGGTDAKGFALSSRPEVPSGAANKSFCACNEGSGLPYAGIPIGMWLPSTLYETTFAPGCSSVLGGIRLGISDPLYRGTSGFPAGDLTDQSFNHVHLYSYPLVAMMELFTSCESQFSDIDVLYMSEVDPMWNDPVIALYGNPMSIFGTSLPAQAACAADAVSASMGKPIDELFWCGGTWSSTMAPYTGIEHAQGPMQFSSATSQKLLAMNVARGITRNKKGNDALCKAQFDPMIERSGYRWQVAWPRPEGTRNHASGETPLRWAGGRLMPGVAELPIYLLWEWTDCCSPILGDN